MRLSLLLSVVMFALPLIKAQNTDKQHTGFLIIPKMSLSSNRYIYVDPNQGSLCSADAPGAQPDRKGGACFSWEIVEE